MKRMLRLALSLILFGALTLHIHTGCESSKGKGMQHYLCSVNSDGSNFTRIYYNDNENTEPGCSSGLYKNYLFRVYCGKDRLLLVYEDSYRVMNFDGSGLRNLTSFIQHNHANVTFAGAPETAFFNYNTVLYKAELGAGQLGSGAYCNNTIYYPLGDMLNNKVYLGGPDHRIYIYDAAGGLVTDLLTSFQLDRAFYVPSLNKYLCQDYNGHITLVSSDGTDADTLLTISQGYYSYESVMLPVGDGTRFLTVGNPGGSAQSALILNTIGDTTAVNLGPIYSHSHIFMDPSDGTNYAIDVCRNGRYIFWGDAYAIYRYDLLASTRDVVMVSGEDNFAAQKFESISSNADGTKLYFVCDLYDHTPLK